MNAQRLAWMPIMLAGQLLYSGQVGAESWQQAVSSRLSTEFDTNPVMSPTHSGGVWRALFEPSYGLRGKFGDSELNTGLALHMERSSNKALSPDRDSPTVFLNWLSPSDAGEFGISSRYAQMATRDSGGVDATGRVPVASTSTSRTLSGSWSKDLSERSALSADGEYGRVTYKGGPYIDYSSRSGGLKFSYLSSEQITTFFRLSGNKYIPVNGGSANSLTEATLGLTWKVEYMDWTVQAGKSRVGGSNSESQGSVAANYTGQQSQLALSAARTVTPSGLGGFVKTNQVSGRWSYALSEYSNTGIDLGWGKNLPTTTIGASTSSNSGAWIDHELTSLWKVRANYQHRTVQGGGLPSASSNLLGLSFLYSNIDF